MPKKLKNQEVVIYQTKSGALELRGDFSDETVWATLDQIAEVFGRDKSVISRHFKNIYKEGELKKRATVAKNATVQIEGNCSEDANRWKKDDVIHSQHTYNLIQI